MQLDMVQKAYLKRLRIGKGPTFMPSPEIPWKHKCWDCGKVFRQYNRCLNWKPIILPREDAITKTKESEAIVCHECWHQKEYNKKPENKANYETGCRKCYDELLRIRAEKANKLRRERDQILRQEDNKDNGRTIGKIQKSTEDNEQRGISVRRSVPGGRLSSRNQKTR
jgi:hypothetical protein